MESIENLPSSVYYGGVFGSILLSIVLFAIGQKTGRHLRRPVGAHDFQLRPLQQTFEALARSRNPRHSVIGNRNRSRQYFLAAFSLFVPLWFLEIWAVNAPDFGNTFPNLCPHLFSDTASESLLFPRTIAHTIHTLSRRFFLFLPLLSQRNPVRSGACSW